jgi:hypothetical protein
LLKIVIYSICFIDYLLSDFCIWAGARRNLSSTDTALQLRKDNPLLSSQSERDDLRPDDGGV